MFQWHQSVFQLLLNGYCLEQALCVWAVVCTDWAETSMALVWIPAVVHVSRVSHPISFLHSNQQTQPLFIFPLKSVLRPDFQGSVTFGHGTVSRAQIVFSWCASQLTRLCDKRGWKQGVSVCYCVLICKIWRFNRCLSSISRSFAKVWSQWLWSYF